MSRSIAINRGGRPQKSALDRKTVAFTPRFTELQAAVIRSNAANIGITPTDYVHRATIKHELTVPTRRTADPQMVLKLDELLREAKEVKNQLAALGNNVNQIAARMNSGIPYDPKWDYAPQYLDEAVDAIAHLSDNADTLLNNLVDCDDS